MNICFPCAKVGVLNLSIYFCFECDKCFCDDGAGRQKVEVRRYGILVLFVERSIFRTAEIHGILVLDLEHSNYLSHTCNF